MKQLFFIGTIFFCIPFVRAQYQNVTINVDVSAALRVQSIACESEQEMQITYNQYHGFGGIGTTDYYYKADTPTACDPSRWFQDYSQENGSLKWEDEAGNILTYNPNDRTSAYVKPSKSGVFKVSWQNTTFFAANECRPAYYVTTKYAGTSNPLIVVPKAKSQTLTANKDAVHLGLADTLLITASGCPNSTPHYTFLHQFYRADGHCEPPSDDAYRPIGANTQKTLTTHLDYEQKYYYKAKCYTDICPYEPLSASPLIVRGIIKPDVPAPNCNQGEKEEVDYIKTRSDYHYYKVTQDICDKSTDPDCSVENVFNLLKSQQKLSVPQYEDFKDIYNTLTKIGGYALSRRIPALRPFIVASELGVNVYQRFSSTQHCQQTGVYSPSSYLFIGKATPVVLDCFTGTNGAVFWDPITQGIDYTSKTVTNYTLPGHALHPGKVMITVKQDNCKVYAQVIGMGNSREYDCSQFLGTLLSTKVNVAAGLSAFPNLMVRLRDYYTSKTWK